MLKEYKILDLSLSAILSSWSSLIQCLSCSFTVGLTIVPIRYPINASSYTYMDWVSASQLQLSLYAAVQNR